MLDQWFMARSKENQVFFNYEVLKKIKNDKKRHGLSSDEIKHLINYGILLQVQIRGKISRGCYFEYHLTEYAINILEDLELSKMTHNSPDGPIRISPINGLSVPQGANPVKTVKEVDRDV